MEENKDTGKQQPIDIAKTARFLWTKRKVYFIVLPLVLVATYLLTLCAPRYYKCTVELAPESSGGADGGTLGAIASSFGIDGLDNLGSNSDAINVMLYPDLLQSPDFIVTLFPVRVTTIEGASYSYYEYMEKHQKMAVWDRYVFMPLRRLVSPQKPSPAFRVGDRIDLRHLSRMQDDIIHAMSGNIKCDIDKKTYAISITVKDQDPEVCATIGDSVLSRIQSFIVDYRTKKARNDYNYYKRLLEEAKGQYNKALGSYAGYYDSHRNAVDQSVIAKTEDNSKNMNLKYQTYSSLAVQLQAAEAKIQENTPAFTVLKSATFPQKPAGPKRMGIALGMTILAFMIISAYFLARKH